MESEAAKVLALLMLVVGYWVSVWIVRSITGEWTVRVAARILEGAWVQGRRFADGWCQLWNQGGWVRAAVVILWVMVPWAMAVATWAAGERDRGWR